MNRLPSVVRGLSSAFAPMARTACAGGHGTVARDGGVPRGISSVTRADGTSSGSWFDCSQVDNYDITLINSSGSTLATPYPRLSGAWSIDWTWYASS